MKCTEKTVLQQRLDNDWEAYKRVETELRQACDVYVATGQIRISPPRAGCYQAWLGASRELDRHLSTQGC